MNFPRIINRWETQCWPAWVIAFHVFALRRSKSTVWIINLRFSQKQCSNAFSESKRGSFIAVQSIAFVLNILSFVFFRFVFGGIALTLMFRRFANSWMWFSGEDIRCNRAMSCGRWSSQPTVSWWRHVDHKASLNVSLNRDGWCRYLHWNRDFYFMHNS